MKKLFLIAGILFLFSDCRTTSYIDESDKVYFKIGMTEKQFLNDNLRRKNQPVRATSEQTVWQSCNENKTNCLFFYFKSDTLFAMDKGERVPDILIENKNK